MTLSFIGTDAVFFECLESAIRIWRPGGMLALRREAGRSEFARRMTHRALGRLLMNTKTHLVAREHDGVERPLKEEEYGAAYRLFARLTAELPHGFLVSEERFYRFLAGPSKHLSKSATLASVRNGEVLAFARVGCHQTCDLWSHAGPGDGLLFGPWFLPSHKSAALETVEMAESWCQRHRSMLLFAFDHVEAASFPEFNGGWAGLSERLWHIGRLLSRSGFRICRRELCLQRSLENPIDSCPPVPGLDTRVEEQAGRMTITANEGRLVVGHCSFAKMYPGRATSPEAKQSGYVDGLRVEERRRGRGIGRWLITRALEEMQRIGCKECRLTTGSENFVAQNLYYSLGFAIRDSAVTFERLRW